MFILVLNNNFIAVGVIKLKRRKRLHSNCLFGVITLEIAFNCFNNFISAIFTFMFVIKGRFIESFGNDLEMSSSHRFFPVENY